MINEAEIRQSQANVNLNDERKISGYAIRFNEYSEIMTAKNGEQFKEIILPSAVDEDLIKRSDIFALLNHKQEEVLARCKFGKGNLHLTIDDKGLKYEFEAFDDDISKRVLNFVKYGLIDSSSFSFSIDPNDKEAQTWKKGDDGIWIRTIKKIDKLYDVSPVYNPAYATTTCNCRALDIEMERIANRITKKLDEILEKAKLLSEK